MEFDVNKLLILLGVVVVIGIGVINSPKLFKSGMSTAVLENALDFNLDAKRACINTIAEKAKKTVGDPSTTDGNGKTKVIYTWIGADSMYGKITCTYESAGKGVTNVTVDGNAIAL